jgi:hypothetical protein
MVCTVSNIYLPRTKRHAAIKLTPLEGEQQQIFVTCGRRVTPIMTTRSATVDMAI